jgi:hypothetical protein
LNLIDAALDHGQHQSGSSVEELETDISEDEKDLVD